MGKPGLVDIRAKHDTFVFTVETTGALKPDEIVILALKVLERKLDVAKAGPNPTSLSSFTYS
jgi:DNA-directed RNA polymerase II subunit RPB3